MQVRATGRPTFLKTASTSTFDGAPSRIRTCAHGSGGRLPRREGMGSELRERGVACVLGWSSIVILSQVR
jgi:hypothetical protein